MEKLGSILLLLIWIPSFGQSGDIKGTWITPEQDLILIEDTAENSNDVVNQLLENRIVNLSIYGDTLSFQKRYYESMDKDAKLIVDRYDLIILSNNDTDLIVQPVSELSKTFFQNRKSLKFTRQEYSIDKTIHFEKIIYHASECSGYCPVIDLEIDSSQNIYINYVAENYFNYSDTFKSGKYIGRLNDTLYNELILLIKTCNLKTLRFDKIISTGGSYMSFIFYFNGERKYLGSMLPPSIMNRLITYLNNINKRAELSITKEKRTLEE